MTEPQGAEAWGGDGWLAHVGSRARDVLHRVREVDRTLLTILLPCLALVVGAWTFIEVADAILEPETPALDETILVALRTPGELGALRGPGWVDQVARDLTALGGLPVLALFTVVAVIYLGLRRRVIYALLVMGAVSGGTLLFVGLKALFGRTRPTVVPMLVVESAPSFPSGHATMSAIVYLSVAVIVARYESRAALRAYVLLAGLLVTGLVGATRVVLGVHYPSDVLAGWALGLAWAAVWWLVAIWVERRRSDRPS